MTSRMRHLLAARRGGGNRSRRALSLFCLLGLAAALTTAGFPHSTTAGATTVSPIRHVVVIYQENHSFDNVLGNLCVVDNRCNGATSGKTHDGTTVQLARGEDLVPAMPHGNGTMKTVINGGSMNGWDLIKGCGPSSGYRCYQSYRPDQIPNLAALARKFVISDRTFQMDSVPTWAAHMDIVAASLDGFLGKNPVTPKGNPNILGWGCDSYKDSQWQSAPGAAIQMVPSCIPKPDGSGPYRSSPVPWEPTIMGSIDKAGLTWRLYGTQGPGQGGGGYAWSICPTFAACIFNQGARANFQDQSNFMTDAAAGTLPNFSVITPKGGPSQHNGTSMLTGDNYIGKTVSAVMNGPDWDSTAIFITYDDCGCFYDHVTPPAGLSLRTPMVIVSPYARAGYTDSTDASYASILAYTEHNFGLPSLNNKTATAYDYSNGFDYTQTPLSPVKLGSTRLPSWEQTWLQAHPLRPNVSEGSTSLRTANTPKPAWASR